MGRLCAGRVLLVFSTLVASAAHSQLPMRMCAEGSGDRGVAPKAVGTTQGGGLIEGWQLLRRGRSSFIYESCNLFHDLQPIFSSSLEHHAKISRYTE